MVRIAGYAKDSLVDGPGLRLVIFFQGCPFACKGCHNESTWDFKGGKEESIEEIAKLWENNKLIDGVTFSGGEPFVQPENLLKLVKKVKERNLHVLIYTGFLYEDLKALNDKVVNEILSLADILIDGPYIESKKDPTLLYRGSSNQRIIDLKKV